MDYFIENTTGLNLNGKLLDTGGSLLKYLQDLTNLTNLDLGSNQHCSWFDEKFGFEKQK